ncbi:glycosyltransferase [Marinigracilibium pacificum]|uniref:Glycosyltransferase n=1 Tax=Marinigracilibium pacificum TaxID=2729599 RepID=A0A848J5G6_9BACT|nr:glycosyltransferase [Marinigracilibium pacificum]NMM50715.1 glycosyltransferase [Marinigracilibium pacificum]
MIYLIASILSIDIIIWFIFLLFRFKKAQIEYTPFCSVLIMARNEEDVIADCIESLLSQDYPSEKIEILICDDSSTDRTHSILEKYQNHNSIRIFKGDYPELPYLNNKAQGLNRLANEAKGEVYLFTDADCILPPGWVKEMTSNVFRKQEVVIAPTLPVGNTLISFFQRIDWIMALGRVISVQGLGIPVTGNGNNMAIPSRFYHESGGYAACHGSFTEDAAIFYKVLNTTEARGGVVANNEVIAVTKPKNSWVELVSQRFRWWLGGVNEAPYWLVFYLFESLWLILFSILMLIGFHTEAIIWFSGRIVLRVLYNCSLPASFNKIAFFRYISALILFDFYSIILNFTVLAKWVMGKHPKWKGRKVKK